MPTPEEHDSDDKAVGLPRAQNLRSAPHPILDDPRANPRNGPGFAHEHNGLNILCTRMPGLPIGMSEATAQHDHESIKMKCCCGRSDCAYLEHNDVALGGLEKSLETAARLGQALLIRHESYINESQAERARLSTCISDLEAERLSLQNANEEITAENKKLQHQLEYLNESLADSDRDVKRLETLLAECEAEVKRLSILVRKTEELDNKLQEMEWERELLSRQTQEGREETRSMLTRWRESERKVRELEEEVHRIEREARLDREQHEEVVAKLEKERALDCELSGAEGRLKGAAAFQSMDSNGTDSKNVVSHFVKDILQDNANLQAGIAELRQLLQASNEEVQNLRDQVMLHQPVAVAEGSGRSQEMVSLDQELPPEATSPNRPQREVHVHHHYHTKPVKSRMATAKKPSKRRAMTSGYGEPSDPSLPTTPSQRFHRFSSGPIAPLNLQGSSSNRWSMQSSATMSSVLSSIPSSPRSYFDRNGSIFDRLEQGEESSRPTSPESVGELLSPGPGQWRFKKDVANLDVCEEEETQKPPFEMSPLAELSSSFGEHGEPVQHETEPPEPELELTPKPSILLRVPVNEAEDPQDQTKVATPPMSTKQNGLPLAQSLGRKSSQAVLNIPDIRPSLTRKGSHETLVSISGMDIHIAQRPPATATLELLHSHFTQNPSQTRKVSAVQPIASVTEYTAISSPALTHQFDVRHTPSYIPASIEALSGIAVPKPRVARTPSQSGAIGRLGGWVRGKWGIAPTKSIGDLKSLSAQQASAAPPPPPVRPHVERLSTTLSDHSASSNSSRATDSARSTSMQGRLEPEPDLTSATNDLSFFFGRSPGVNQPGFIPGFRAAAMSKRTPSQVMASVIDEEGLQEGLAELSDTK